MKSDSRLSLCSAAPWNAVILLSVDGLPKRGSAMRSGFLALFLCAHLTALSQSVAAAPAGSAELGRNQQFTLPWTACNTLSPQVSILCAAPHRNALPTGSAAASLWSTPQIDASHLLASPLLGNGEPLPRPQLALNGPLIVSPMRPSLWPGAKGEPIPTQWPNAKLEKIPTQWPHLAMVPIGSEHGASFAAHPPVK